LNQYSLSVGGGACQHQWGGLWDAAKKSLDVEDKRVNLKPLSGIKARDRRDLSKGADCRKPGKR